MTTFDSILCPVDFSEQSRRALRLAGTLSERFDSRLAVLSVVNPLLAEAAKVRMGLDLAKEETQPALSAFVKETWRDAPGARDPRLLVRIGDAAEAIVETAATDGVQLIVMGTQGLGGLRKWLLGSTAEHVLRRTRTPVLTVPATESDVSRDTRQPLGPGPVLAATDFSGSAALAVQYAAEFSLQTQVPLVLAHVVEPVIVPSRWAAYVDDSNEARVRGAANRMKEIERNLPSGTRPAETVVVLGRPEEAIARIGEERQAGLIVIGLAADDPPFGRRPGSIAYGVLSSAKVPVLVVPLTADAG